MDKPNILLLGDGGYLGSFLKLNLECDVLEKIKSERRIYNNGCSYDYIINCIGKPDVDYCENNIAETNYSNWYVLYDIKTCYPKAKIINFSSYYVYNDYYCDEESNTTQKYKYCEQKLLGEQENADGLNFRIGKLFGNPNSQQGKLTDYIIKNKDKEITLDRILFNPTSVYQILCILQMEFKYKKLNKGVYNLGNDGFTSHYKYGKFIVDYLGLKTKINQVDKMSRTFDNYGKFLMDLSKLNRIYPLIDWRYDMEYYLKNL